MRLPVLVAADGAAWEAALLAELERGTAPVTVVRRCVDLVELLSVAASGQGRAALLAGSLRRLDADAVDRLLAAEVAPVGVVPRDDAAAEQRLRALGVDHLVPDDADPTVLVGVLLEAAAARSRAEPDPAGERSFADPAGSLAVPSPPGPAGDATEDPGRQGIVLAVWGPTGAPGRTTVAITLADEAARLGRETLLIDADVYGGTVAAHLGLLDESPGVAAACRAAAASRLGAQGLAELCWQLGPRLRTLTGVPLASRWTELRPAALTAVLAAARRLADVTVVDCGFCLETDEELSFDSLAPRRNGATLAVLDAADRVVVVGAADPIGMQRLVRGLAELQDAEIAAPRDVVLTKVRSGAVPGDTRAELVRTLDTFCGVRPAALLPDDRAGLDHALATGRSLGESRPGSPLRRAVVEFAAGLLGVPLAGTRRR